MAIKTEEELAGAINNEEDTIEIEGDLKNKVLKIKATGKVAWVIAIGAIAIALPIAIGSGGVAAPVSGFVGIGAVSILGLSATTSAVVLSVAAGGIGALKKLRAYKIVENNEDTLKLKRV